jgi:hypothetical protein
MSYDLLPAKWFDLDEPAAGPAAALAGSASASISAGAPLSTGIPLAGVAASTVSATAALNSGVLMAGSAAVGIAATAPLSTGIPLSGAGVVGSTIAAPLTTGIALGGAPTASSSAAADLSTQIEAAGSAVAAVSVVGSFASRTYRAARLAVSIQKPSSDGFFWGRYPQGDKPPLSGAAVIASAAAAGLSTGIRLAIAASAAASASASLTTGGGSLSAVGNFTLSNQGGSTNGQFPVTSPLMQMTMTWTAATGPVHHYRAKRGVNGGVKTTYDDTIASSATSWTDTAATNFYNAMNIQEASSGNVLGLTTWYDYDIVAVDASGNEGPTPAQFTAYIYYNGVSYCSSEDLSFGMLSAPNYSAIDPLGGTAIKCIKGSGGCGLQTASFNPTYFNFGLEVNMFNYLNVEILPGLSGEVFDLAHLTRSPVGDVFPHINLGNFANSGVYGSAPVAGQYALYKVPLSAFGFGETVFDATIVSGVMNVTNIVSGPGIDPTCWIATQAGGALTTPGASQGVWVSSEPSQSGVGTYQVSMGPTAGTNPPDVPTTTRFVCHKSNAYKLDLKDFTSASGTTFYVRKYYFTRN